jgi:lambda family phage portal protein
LSPVVIRLKDLDDYEDGQLQRQKMASCFVAFVQDIGPDMTDEDEECDELGEKLEPAQIEFLPPGKTVTFADPPAVQNYNEYVTTLLHGIATGVGMSYEVLTGDLSQVNFSSARMGWLEFSRNIGAWRDGILTPYLLDPVAKDFMEILTIMGANVENILPVHTPPKREMIDPTKEIPAAVEALRGGLTTWSDEISALGKDPKEHFQQYKQDLQALDELGIKLDSDPRQQKTSNIASNQQGEENETNSGARTKLAGKLQAGDLQRERQLN